MGLIDKVRNQRDSWIKRFEEQRQDQDDDEFENLSEEEQEELIRKNRERVGKFPFDDKDK